MHIRPCFEAVKLPFASTTRKVVPSTLQTRRAVWQKAQAAICTVHLLGHDEMAPYKRREWHSTESFIAVLNAGPGKMRRAWIFP